MDSSQGIFAISSFMWCWPGRLWTIVATLAHEASVTGQLTAVVITLLSSNGSNS